MTSLHARLAGLTLLLLLLWGITSMQMRRRTADLLPTADIAVEHTAAAGMTVTRTADGRGPAEIRNDSNETLHVSIPDSWERDEVRGAPLAAVTADEPSLGFRRWTVPTHAAVTFIADDVWNKLHIRNISESPLRLGVVTVDIGSGKAVTESLLVDDESLLRFR
jgi:hypothetical protein